jgi:chromosome partitioning protein
MTKVISVINFKGGVGKTTTTVALAEIFSFVMNKRVLVIDLDPQSNASLMLLGERKMRAIIKKKYTLAQLFSDVLFNTAKFDIDNVLQKGVSDVSVTPRRLDLLPSSLELVSVQDRLILAVVTPMRAVKILSEAVAPILDQYDIVLIDHPPGMGTVTQNGLFISDEFIIPVIPDFLSTYGIPQVLELIKDFSSATEKEIKPLGISINRFSQAGPSPQRMVDHLQALYNNVFQAKIPQAVDAARIAEYAPAGRTLAQKYGSVAAPLRTAFTALADEALWKLDAL